MHRPGRGLVWGHVRGHVLEEGMPEVPQEPPVGLRRRNEDVPGLRYRGLHRGLGGNLHEVVQGEGDLTHHLLLLLADVVPQPGSVLGEVDPGLRLWRPAWKQVAGW